MYITAYQTTINPLNGWKIADKSKRYTFEVPDLQEQPYINRNDLEFNKLDEMIREVMVRGKHYVEFDIPKRNGKMRHIKAPTGILKYAQAYLMNYFKNSLSILTHNCCHGFEKGRTCLTSLQVHQANGSKYFLKLDVHDFFPSITEELLYTTMRNIANCKSFTYEELMKFAFLLTDETGHMTQGCISSPYFSNLVMLSFDCRFSNWCAEHNLVYTRYADDMLISSREPFKWSAVQRKADELLPAGLHLNKEKTQYRDYLWHNFALGLCYNKDMQITCGRELKHKFKVVCHKLQQGDETIDKVLWHGRLMYYSHIEPEYFSNPRFDILRRI